MIRGWGRGKRAVRASNQSQPMRRFFWLRRLRQLNQMRRTSCRNPFRAPPVVRHAEVAVMAAQDAGIPAVLLGQRRVHQPPRLLAQRLQLARQALALRLVLHDEPAVPGPPAVVGEAEKGEGFRSPLATLLSSQGRKPAKLDQPRLVLVERQAELGQPLLEVDQHPLRIGRASRSPSRSRRRSARSRPDRAHAAAAIDGPRDRGRSAGRCWPGAG